MAAPQTGVRMRRRVLAADDLTAGRGEVFGPRACCFLEALFRGMELLQHPLRLVAELGLALVQGLACVTKGDLRFLELRAEFDGALVLRHRRLEHTRTAVSIALPLRAAVARPPVAGAPLARAVSGRWCALNAPARGRPGRPRRRARPLAPSAPAVLPRAAAFGLRRRRLSRCGLLRSRLALRAALAAAPAAPASWSSS